MITIIPKRNYLVILNIAACYLIILLLFSLHDVQMGGFSFALACDKLACIYHLSFLFSRFGSS